MQAQKAVGLRSNDSPDCLKGTSCILSVSKVPVATISLETTELLTEKLHSCFYASILSGGDRGETEVLDEL